MCPPTWSRKTKHRERKYNDVEHKNIPCIHFNHIKQEYDTCWTEWELHQEKIILPQGGSITCERFSAGVDSDEIEWIKKRVSHTSDSFWVTTSNHTHSCESLRPFQVNMWLQQPISGLLTCWASCQRSHPSYPVDPESTLPSIGSTQLPLLESICHSRNRL